MERARGFRIGSPQTPTLRLTGCPGEAAAAGAPKPVLAGAAPKADPGVPKGDAAPELGVPNPGELYPKPI
jgi:hypothetical protein